MKHSLTCIRCPLGCNVIVEIENNEIVSIKGNTCPRGEQYANVELFAPVRTLTSTVKVKNGVIDRVPVKTQGEISKEKVFACMQILNKLEFLAPIEVGDVLVENILDTNVDIVATKSIERI